MSPTKAIIRKMKIQFICARLQTFMYLLGRPLKLHAVSAPDILVFSGSSVDLSWQVSGCYKIVINKHFILPGYVSRVELDVDQVPDVLEIEFFGYGRQLRQSFKIQKMKINLQKENKVALPVWQNKIKPEHAWPQLKAVMQLRVVQSLPGIRQQSLQLHSMPQVHLPLLHLQLEPYPLQLNQPDYETTVL
jgi:hypothetical protein